MTPAHNEKELAVDMGCELLAARTRKGWTQNKLAKRMGTLQPSIARAERGNILPSLTYVMRAAKAMSMGVEIKIVPK